jgi:glycosyltransferase involved in cell wall biosynthesis
MKILYVAAEPGLNIDTSLSSAVYTGSVSHITNLIHAFQKIGIEVVPLARRAAQGQSSPNSRYATLKRRFPNWFTCTLRDAYKLLQNLVFLKTYRTVFGKENPDFIYERGATLHFMTGVLARALHIPYILEINAPPSDVQWFTRSPFLPLIAFLQKRSAIRADTLVVVSERLKEHFIDQGIAPEKIMVLANAVDTELFAPGKSGQDVRGKYHIPAHQSVIGFVGSMRRYHGLDTFIEAARQILERDRNVQFMLVGPCAEADELERDLESNGLRGNVIVTGGIPYTSVPEYISAMDICVMPNSNAYGSPIKIFEYGAMEKPVIAPRVGPVEEVIEDGRHGLLIRPGDPQDLTEKIFTLLGDPDLRKALSSALRKKVQAEHTWKRNALRILERYERQSRNRVPGR